MSRTYNLWTTEKRSMTALSIEVILCWQQFWWHDRSLCTSSMDPCKYCTKVVLVGKGHIFFIHNLYFIIRGFINVHNFMYIHQEQYISTVWCNQMENVLAEMSSALTKHRSCDEEHRIKKSKYVRITIMIISILYNIYKEIL